MVERVPALRLGLVVQAGVPDSWAATWSRMARRRFKHLAMGKGCYNKNKDSKGYIKIFSIFYC